MFINRIGKKTGGVINAQVSAGADDGNWYPSDGDFYPNEQTNTIGYSDGGRVHIFARFPSIVIPAGVTIKAAHIEVYLSSIDAGTLADNRIYLNHEQAPTAPTAAVAAENKTLTTAYVDFNPATPVDCWKTSADISSVVQEVVDAHGPLSAILILWRNNGSVKNFGKIRMSDYTGNAHGMKLHVEW